MATKARTLDPIPPGEILMEEFMRPLGLSINALARALAVPANRVSGIINGNAGDLGRYGAAPGQVLRDVAGDLARPAVGLRTSRRPADDLAGRGAYREDPGRLKPEGDRV